MKEYYSIDTKDKNPDRVPIEIIKGKFKGFKFIVLNVGFDEINDACHLKFDYELLEEKHLKNKEELEKLIGDIILDIIEDLVYNEQERFKLTNNNNKE